LLKKNGVNRAAAILSAFNPTTGELEEFISLLSLSYQRAIIPGGVVCVDEFLNAYDPTKRAVAAANLCGDPIPLAYFPNKPHKIGLLSYMATLPIEVYNERKGRTQRLPYTVDWLLSLELSQVLSTHFLP